MTLYMIKTRETIDREYLIEAVDEDAALKHWHEAGSLHTSDVQHGGEKVRSTQKAFPTKTNGDAVINEADGRLADETEH